MMPPHTFHTNSVTVVIQPQLQRQQTNFSFLLRRRQHNPMTALTTGFVVLLLLLMCVHPRPSNHNDPFHIVLVNAYPTGAGSCAGGVPAVGGPHIAVPNNSTSTNSSTSSSKLVQSSSLFDNDFLVAIDDTVMTAATTSNPTLNINTPHTISVYNNRFLYKGILIRLEVPTTSSTSNSTNFTFIPTTNTQVSFVCVAQGANVLGITHTNSSFKSIHSGILEISQPTTNVILDITVVGVNNETISLYAYDRIYVDFIDPNAAPIATTTTTRPTASPVVTTTTVPPVSEAPTDEPTTSNITTTPTATPSTTASNVAVVPTPMKLRKTVNVTIDDVDDNDSIEYTFIGENLQVQLSYILSSSLTDGEIRAYERITSTWYNDFYNTNFYTVHNATTNMTDIIVTEMGNTTTDDDANRKLQQVFSLSNNYGVIMGSMRSTINVTNVTYLPYDTDQDMDTDNITTKTNIHITYSQMITYRNSDNALQNMQQQYLTIPYRSRIGRQLYIESLIASNIYTFSHLSHGDISSTDTLSVPLLVGPPPQSPTTESSAKTEENDKFAKGYIAVITIGGIAVIAVLIIVFQNNKYRFVPKSGADEEVTASELLAEQRKQYADDIGSLQLHDSDISGADIVDPASRGVAESNAKEYIIYAPAGRLGIVLDDPTVLGNTSNKELKGPVISMIKEGSPLINDSNLNVGDMVVAIDDIDVRSMTPQKVSKLINDRSKHPIRKITCIRIPNMIQNINVPE